MNAYDNVRADPLADPVGRLILPGNVSPGEDGQGGKPSLLDSASCLEDYNKLLGWVQYEKRRQAPNRMQMALDCDYYDGIQFTDEDIMELLDRGQAPLVYNLVKRTADWVIGTEKRTRFDYKVLGRTNDDVAAARIKTDAMKYFQDVNRTPFHRSQAFRESVIAGLGWLEDAVRADSDEEPIYSRNESWWYSLGDSHAMQLDNTDARYHFRWRYVDVDVAEAMFPKRKAFVRNSAQNGVMADEKMLDEFYLGNRLAGEDYTSGQYSRLSFTNHGFVDSSRDRVKLYEGWYKQPVYEKTVRSKRLPNLNGETWNADDSDLRHAVLIGDASVVERMNMRVFYMIFTEGGVLAHGRSPYRHNQFPFTPVWCYRRGRDNAPYGIIRNIRDPQDGFNRRMAKAIFALTAYRVEATSDAIDTKTQSWEDVRIEAGRPDALLVRKAGANTQLTVSQDRALGEEHLKLAQTEGSLILDASGVTADNLGLESNAESGKAIIAKQAEGAAVTSEIFDNYRLACQLQGEKQLSLIEQFVTEEKVLRITDARGNPSWKKVNEVTVDPKTQAVRVLNDITSTKADFVIDQQDFHATQRQAASQALMEAMPKMANLDPKIMLRILRMAVDSSDWPNKEEIVKELDAITGYRDPSAALTPEEKQEQQEADQQQQAMEQEQEAMKKAAFEAELQEKRSKAAAQEAAANKNVAEAERIYAEIDGRLPGQNEEVTTPAVNQETEAEARLKESQAALHDAKRELVSSDAEVKHAQAEKLRADAEAQRAAAERSRYEVTTESRDTTKQEVDAIETKEQMADLFQDVVSLRETMGSLASELTAAVKEGPKSLAEAMKNLAPILETAVSNSLAKNKKDGDLELDFGGGKKIIARRRKPEKPEDF